MIEVFDSSGRVVATARERVVLEGVAPDLYRGRLVTTEGISLEKTLEVDLGEQLTDCIEAPAAAPPLSRIAFSSLVGLTAPHLRVAGVSRHAVRPIDCAAELLAGEHGAQSSPDGRHASSGTYAVSLPLRSEPRELVVALPVLQGWQTVLLIDETDDSAQQMRAVVALVDGESTVALLERLEVAERYTHAGLFRAALAMSEEHAHHPLFAVIQAYALLRLTQMSTVEPGSGRRASSPDHAGRLSDAVHHLRATASTLSDTKLLEAEVALLHNDGSARVHCEEAIDRGAPLFAFGALRLLTLVTRFEIEHPGRQLLERAASSRVRGWPWTAWWQ